MKIKINRTITDNTSPKDIINLLIKDRNITNEKLFLEPTHPRDIVLKDFFKTDYFEKTWPLVIKKLETIYEKKEPIVVYTDYDADGITGGAILWETLFLLGFNVMPYVPNRHTEGYGFSLKGLDAVKEKYNPSLIISVDHGIAAAEKITYAKSIGIPIIVTDHHMKSSVSPDDALAVFHIDALSGSGVSYFFSKELFEVFKDRSKNKRKLETYFEKDYLHLATIGTIADLVPLAGPSRSIAKYGLEHFKSCARPGIQHILKDAKIDGKDITPYEIGFMIAPRINAIGRLEHAIDALRLLCTPVDETAQLLAKKIGVHNKHRQELVQVALQEVKDLVSKTKRNKNNIIIVASTEISQEDSFWNEGIIGLLASKLTEEFYRPSIVLTKGDGFLKASARSIPGFDITSFLRSLQEYLVDVGGHSQAAGFTIKREKLDEFIEQAEKKANELITESDLEKTIEVDISLPLSLISMDLYKTFEILKPFGMGNKEPVFLSKGLISDIKLFGKKNEHLKIFVKDINSSNTPMEMILFYGAEKRNELEKNEEKEIIYKLDLNSWNGKDELRGRIVCFT